MTDHNARPPAFYEIDHIFVLSDVGAAAAQRLVAAGLSEGPPNIHDGQGTANRRFFFRNFMLEFLWVQSAAEASSEVVQPTYLLERWQGRADTTSPFGICVRPTADYPGSPAPFETWDYFAPFMPDGPPLQVALNADQTAEPFVFFVDWGTPPDPQQVPVEHEAGLEKLTSAEIRTPHAAALQSPAVLGLGPLVGYGVGDDYLLVLSFDQARQNQELDLRPELPLILRY